MKVLLLKPVKGLGDPGKVIEAKDGYAMNFLIPKGLATTDLEAKIATKKIKLSPEKLSQLFKKISKTKLNINKTTNDDGVLFSSVPHTEIKDMLEKLYPELISAKLEIKIPAHIKSIGEHKVLLRSMGQDVQLKVVVIDSSKTQNKK